jgi:hypothetical protein
VPSAAATGSRCCARPALCWTQTALAWLASGALGRLAASRRAAHPPPAQAALGRPSRRAGALWRVRWPGGAQTARLYDAGRRTLRGSYALVAPALDGAFQDDSVVYVGGLDGLVRRCARPA